MRGFRSDDASNRRPSQTSLSALKRTAFFHYVVACIEKVMERSRPRDRVLIVHDSRTTLGRHTSSHVVAYFYLQTNANHFELTIYISSVLIYLTCRRLSVEVRRKNAGNHPLLDTIPHSEPPSLSCSPPSTLTLSPSRNAINLCILSMNP